MSMLPMSVKCSKCGKKFSYNPSVGNFLCPNCGAPYKPDEDGKGPKLSLK